MRGTPAITKNLSEKGTRDHVDTLWVVFPQNEHTENSETFRFCLEATTLFVKYRYIFIIIY